MSLPDDLSLPARDVLDALSIDEESTELLRDFVEGRDRSLVEAALQELVAHGLVERATREEEFFAAALADPDALDDATRRTYLGPWWQLTEAGWVLFEAEPEPYLITIGLRVAGPLADAEAPTLVAALARHELCLSVHEPEIRHVEPGETSLIVRFAVSGTSRHTARRAAIAVAGAPLAAFREGLGSGRALLDDRLIVSRAADLVGQ